jgi:hypothetical protein
MRVTLALPLLLLAAGCASGAGVGGRPDQTVHLADGAGGVLRLRSDGAKVSTVDYPLERVWRVLPSVFDSLGIALTDLDPSQHQLGNAGMKAHKQLGKVSLTKYLDCGNAQGFPSAETYDIQLSVRTRAESNADGGTSISTLVEAAGRPMAFAGEYVRCTSKSELETRIVDGVKARLR